MSAECLRPMPVELPEWRRSGRFLIIAALLHGALLAYPLQRALTDAAPLSRLAVTLVAPPPEVAPSPRPVSPEPVAKKEKLEKQPVHTKPVVAPPRPILAMPAEQPTAAAAPITVPAPAGPVIATAEAAAKPASAPATAAPVTAARYNAAYLNNPEPKYPALSRRLGEEGKVLLKVRVTAEGLPATVDVEKSSNFARLDEAARQAVAHWRFVPARRGDEAIEASVVVPIVFRLDN